MYKHSSVTPAFFCPPPLSATRLQQQLHVDTIHHLIKVYYDVRMCTCMKSYERWAWTSRRSYTAVMSPKGLIKSITKSTSFTIPPTVLSLSYLCLLLSVFQSFILYSVPSLTPLSSRAQLCTAQWMHPLSTSSPFSISYFHFTLFRC